MLKQGLILPLTATLAMFSSSIAFAKDDSQQSAATEVEQQACPAILQHTVRKLHSSEQVDLCKAYQGKTLLIVNTASNCGYTPQFKALEALYQDYKDEGLVILGFPSDNFFQEEDEEKDTAEVCYVNYGVTFPMFATTVVRGDDAHPIFKELEEKTAAPYWNFYKYLVSNDGQNVQRFSSKVEPQSEELVAAIQQEL
ncbi:glutathione peroxidase [Thalassotalea sp. PS06]|uniref:glutathione peroxidase n=1 Tax=Thalassotalea sp. PS06 TaxID=2594005 RepID=UPI0011630A50|nr:glutathione peroxidase [Thalassotalea sp. PS06]QDP00578.1 glutathione peroxidase [Thalassotalea sp. PS06]